MDAPQECQDVGIHITQLPFANEQAWGELLLMFINFLGEPAHQCPLCRNALAVTCQDVYAWFFYS